FALRHLQLRLFKTVCSENGYLRIAYIGHDISPFVKERTSHERGAGSGARQMSSEMQTQHLTAQLLRQKSCVPEQCSDVQDHAEPELDPERSLARLVTQERLSEPCTRPAARQLQQMQRLLLRSPSTISGCALVECIGGHRDYAERRIAQANDGWDTSRNAQVRQQHGKRCNACKRES